jgi:hypothetical protein
MAVMALVNLLQGNSQIRTLGRFCREASAWRPPHRACAMRHARAGTEQLDAVKGMGPTRLELYGPALPAPINGEQ